MKLVTAIIRPDKLDDVTQAVCAAGARGLTATQVRGFGRQFGHLSPDRPEDAAALVLPKLRIDILTGDELAWPVAEAIAKASNTGTIGDGKLWISPVEDAMRVRTGERGTAAV